MGRAIPYVLALRGRSAPWAPPDRPQSPQAAARLTPWAGPAALGGWTAVVRRFRDGHRETWWAADLTRHGLAPDHELRLVAVTTDPALLPADSTWYLLTNLPHPAAPHAATAPIPAAALAEIVRLYGLRTWVEQSCKQVKQELGWAAWQVRRDAAIRRHWALVCCAFSFCCCAWSRTPGGPPPVARELVPPPAAPPGRVAGERPAVHAPERSLAGRPAPRASLALPLDPAPALVAGVDQRATAAATAAPRSPLVGTAAGLLCPIATKLP